MRKPTWLALIAALALSPGVALALDGPREVQLSAALTAGLPGGEALRLEAGGNSFLALYRPHGTAQRQGGVILLHDLNAHADWPEVIAPLRRELPRHGWQTLSLQLPLPLTDAPLTERTYPELYEASAPRIEAALEYFKSKGIFNIVLVGHGWGAVLGSAFLARSEAAATIKAAVAIDIDNPARLDATLRPELALETIRVPVLEVYAELALGDRADALAARRQGAQRAANPHYRQLQLSGADSGYRGFESVLVKRVGSWLHRYSEGTELQIEDDQQR